MIDTDKYEGHTEGPWEVGTWKQGISVTGICDLDGRLTMDMAKVNAQLIADAPLLLQEVKRLREKLETVRCAVEYHRHVDNV